MSIIRTFGPAMAAVVVFVGAGCGEKITRFEITNYRTAGETEFFHETFDECFFAKGPDGNVDVVARRRIPADGENERLTQLVHLRTVFRAVPGTTPADQTMINGIVAYAIVGEHGGVCFEGAGFVSCADRKDGALLVGELEQAKLRAHRRRGRVGEIFEAAVLAGPFRATRDRKRVISLLNELSSFFGPHPHYQPTPRQDPI